MKDETEFLESAISLGGSGEDVELQWVYLGREPISETIFDEWIEWAKDRWLAIRRK